MEMNKIAGKEKGEHKKHVINWRNVNDVVESFASPSQLAEWDTFNESEMEKVRKRKKER